MDLIHSLTQLIFQLISITENLISINRLSSTVLVWMEIVDLRHLIPHVSNILVFRSKLRFDFFKSIPRSPLKGQNYVQTIYDVQFLIIRVKLLNAVARGGFHFRRRLLLPQLLSKPPYHHLAVNVLVHVLPLDNLSRRFRISRKSFQPKTNFKVFAVPF